MKLDAKPTNINRNGDGTTTIKRRKTPSPVLYIRATSMLFRGGYRRLAGTTSGTTLSFLEKAQARVVVSKDHHAHLRQIFIAASMIAMNMSVDQKANFFVGHLLDGCY